MIHYFNGDATKPRGDGPKILAHVANTSGGWGRGFVLAISRRWPEPERQYRAWHKSKDLFVLGAVQFVRVSNDIVVANMLAQCGYATSTKPAIRYDALKECLERVAEEATGSKATVHMPRIGCGLAGGKWEGVEPIIATTMKDVEVTVYDLPEEWEWKE